MQNFKYNIDIFVELGRLIREEPIQDKIITRAIRQNDWFTRRLINNSINSICRYMLDPNKLDAWLEKYPYKEISHKSVGIIMAGNIPLVGFMDLLTAIVLGAKTYYKPSSKDEVLMEWIVDKLRQLGAEIHLLKDDTKIDILIATGSNNAKRYFEDSYPNAQKLIRGSRVSVAVLDNDTTDIQLDSLWKDCFDYFGLGCRNVSHLFISKDFNINRLAYRWSKRKIKHANYLGSYRQQRAIYSMQDEELIDCGYYLLSKSTSLYTPIGTITYSFFNTEKLLNKLLKANQNNIQCIVCKNNIAFGMAQNPELWDYADNIDLVEFLQK